MIRRISDLKPDLLEACSKLGWRTWDSRFLLSCEKEGKSCIIDGKELSGPVSERHLEQWINEMPPSDHVVLIAMGFFTPSAYKAILKDRERRRKFTLISLGLRDYLDTEFKPKILQLTKPTDLFLELERILKEYGIQLSPMQCATCESKAVAICEACGKLLCRSHVVPCALCRAVFCHPDTASDCLISHRCGK